MVKPAHEGSSIGMARVEDAGRPGRGLADCAREYDPLVLAERWIQGAEYTCAILGREALPLIRLETPHAFYDYDAKYRADSTRYLCPCGLPDGGRAAACGNWPWTPSTRSARAAGAGST